MGVKPPAIHYRIALGLAMCDNGVCRCIIACGILVGVLKPDIFPVRDRLNFVKACYILWMIFIVDRCSRSLTPRYFEGTYAYSRSKTLRMGKFCARVSDPNKIYLAFERLANQGTDLSLSNWNQWASNQNAFDFWYAWNNCIFVNKLS